jgi:hypothetical protein
MARLCDALCIYSVQHCRAHYITLHMHLMLTFSRLRFFVIMLFSMCIQGFLRNLASLGHVVIGISGQGNDARNAIQHVDAVS